MKKNMLTITHLEKIYYDRLEGHRNLVSLLLLILLASIHLPWSLNTPFFIMLSPLLWFHRKEFYAVEGFRFSLICFCCYLFVFTIFSQSIEKSLVADVKVIKGLFFFFFAGLFYRLIKNIDGLRIHSLILLLLVGSNFFFEKEHIIANEYYFSYYGHPNIAGFSLFFFLVMAALLWSLSRDYLEKILNATTIVLGLLLIVIANSRSVWVGIFVFFLVTILLGKKFTSTHKYALVAITIVSTIVLFGLFDEKMATSSMSIRSIVWSTVCNETLRSHPLVGFGLNTYKICFKNVLDLAVMPHNSVVEIFLSSGVIGVGIMSVIFFKLVIIGVRIYQQSEGDAQVISLACAALSGLLVVSFFDFRFFDFKFIASTMVFLGLLNGAAQIPVARAPSGVP